MEPFGDYTHSEESDLQDIDDEDWIRKILNTEKSTKNRTPKFSSAASTASASVMIGEIEGELPGETEELPADPTMRNEFDKKWVHGFVVIEDEEIGPPVCEEAQEGVDQLWDLAMKNSKAMKIAQDYKVLYRPNNCENITFTKMNPLIAELLPEGKDKQDRLPFSIHTGILKGTNGVVLAMNTLMNPELQFEGQAEVLTNLMKTLHCSAYANGRLMDLHRQQIKPYLPWHYHKIVDDVPYPSHQWLFGEKFEEAIAERDRIMAIVRKIKNKQFGGGRGSRRNRGRRPFRYQPYRTNRSGGFRNGRSNIQYDQYGTPYSEYTNLVYLLSVDHSQLHSNLIVDQSGLVTVDQIFPVTEKFHSPGQIAQTYHVTYLHPGDIGCNPNTSLVYSSTEQQQGPVQPPTGNAGKKSN